MQNFYQFADFTVDIGQKVVHRAGKPLPLAPKIFETLLVLVENNGRIVTKEELMNRLWPDTFVEEANLTFNIQQLRKSLGDNARNPVYIETVARRGYRFIAQIQALVNDQVSQVPTKLAPLPVFNSEAKAEITPQEHAIRVNTFNTPPFEGRSQTKVSIPRRATTRSIILASITMVALSAAGLTWRFAGASKNASEQLAQSHTSFLPLTFAELTKTGQSRYGVISPDGKYVAYSQGPENHCAIWLRQLTSSTNLEIVPATELIHGMAFTNSGESLYFVKGDPSGLYRVSVLGGVPVKIADRTEGNFSLSSDDRQVAFIRQAINESGEREYSLIVANADGGNERTVLVTQHPDKLDVPVWSPDDQSIICAFGNSASGDLGVSIIEVKLSDGTKRPLSSERFSGITKMDWLPEKKALIFTARRDDIGNALWRASYPGMEISQITETPGSYSDVSVAKQADLAVATQTIRISNLWVGSNHGPTELKKITQAQDSFCWTPDGELIYSSTASGNTELWKMRADGSEQKQLTTSNATNGTPVVTADNRYIVFTSNRSGSFQLWRMDIDGSDQVQLTYGLGKNNPTVSPDGKWIFYNSTDDWHLWKVSIDGGEPVQLTDYVASMPSVSPDGKFVACIGRNESKREILLLPYEGGAVYKRMDFFGWSSRIQWTADGKVLIYAEERNGVKVMMRQALNGKLIQEPLQLQDDDLFDFGYSPDHRYLAVIRGGWEHDLLLIHGLHQ